MFNSIETRCAVFMTFAAGTTCQVQDPTDPPSPKARCETRPAPGGAGGTGDRISLKRLAGHPAALRGGPWPPALLCLPGLSHFGSIRSKFQVCVRYGRLPPDSGILGIVSLSWRQPFRRSF